MTLYLRVGSSSLYLPLALSTTTEALPGTSLTTLCLDIRPRLLLHRPPPAPSTPPLALAYARCVTIVRAI